MKNFFKIVLSYLLISFNTYVFSVEKNNDNLLKIGVLAPFSGEFKDLGESLDHSKIKEEMKELLLQRITSRKNRVAASDEFVLKERDYTKEDGIMIGVW